MHLFGRPLDWAALQDGRLAGGRACSRTPPARSARAGRGMPCGALGVMGCLSFHPRKIVTTGEGGAVTTDDDGLADGRPAPAPPRHRPGRRATCREPGLNYRLAGHPLRDRHPAARRLDELLAARARVAAGYAERLRELVEPPRADEGDRHGWQAYVIQLDRRDEALEALRAEGIEAQIGTYALHRFSAYRDQGAFPGADRGVRAGARAAVPSTADRGRARPRREALATVRLGLDSRRL